MNFFENYSAFFICYTFIYFCIFIMLYINRGIINHILGLLIIIIVTSCALFTINYNFIAIWLFIIYGGACTMLILIVTSLVKYEIFETSPIKFYKWLLLEVFIDSILLNSISIKMFFLHDSTFNVYHQNFKGETNFWLIGYHLYYFYGNFTIMVACVLFLILINILQINYTENS